jgi:hypothetical protein
MANPVTAEYIGEHEGQDYTVQVMPAADVAPRGKQHVVLRIRFRGITEDFSELIPRSFTEGFIHTRVRLLIADTWPS